MVERISGINHNGYKNDLSAKTNAKDYEYLNAQLPETKPDSVTFTGNHDDDEESHTHKEKESNSHATAYIITTALLIGAFFTGKYFNKIKNAVSPKAVDEAATKAKDAAIKAKDTVTDATRNVIGAAKKETAKAKNKLAKAKNRVTERIQVGRKKIKDIPSSRAKEAITPEKAVETAANINTQHVNGNTRRTVEKAVAEQKAQLITPKEQAAYDADIAYQPLKTSRKAAQKLDKKNSAQRAELNSISNNSKGTNKLEAVRAEAVKLEQAMPKIKDGYHLNPSNNNMYLTQDGQVYKIITKTPNSKGEYTITDPKKIAMHLAKENVDLTAFAA